MPATSLKKRDLITLCIEKLFYGDLGSVSLNSYLDDIVQELYIPDGIVPTDAKGITPAKRMAEIGRFAIRNPEHVTDDGSTISDRIIEIGRHNFANRPYLSKSDRARFEELYKDVIGRSVDGKPDDQSRGPSVKPQSRKVFIVHGHDEGAREAVARFLEQIDFEPIILHEQANQGRTVIEKVEDHGDVSFVVVLLTPDDKYVDGDGSNELRVRQNVLLELGYFMGRLGRKRVCALKRGEVAVPSDFAGVVWEVFDNAGGWKYALARELQAAGHEIDWNKAMRF